MAIPDLNKLKPVLLNSGVQKSNPALHQVIWSLIDFVQQNLNAINTATGAGSGSGGAGAINQSILTVNNDTATLPNSRQLIAGAGIQFNDSPDGRRIISASMPLGGGDGGEGEDGPPGPPGLPGEQGPIGPAGANATSMFYAFDGEDGEDGLPGLTGPQGFTGSQGAAGPPGTPGIDGNDGERGEDSFIPGPAGSIGPAGIQGLMGPPGIDGEDPLEPLMIPGPQGIQGPAGGGGGGGLTLTDFSKDLGIGRAGTFDITGLAGLTPSKDVLIIQTAQPISSKGDARDEFEMQPIILTGYVVDAATIRAYWRSESITVGIYNFAYAVSG